jgi:hypothetical protein
MLDIKPNLIIVINTGPSRTQTIGKARAMSDNEIISFYEANFPSWSLQEIANISGRSINEIKLIVLSYEYEKDRNR